MNALFRFLNSSIGRKYVMAVTGLSLVLFLITHLAGNLTLFASNEAFNHYAEVLESNPLLPLAETGLFLVFVTHIAFAFLLIARNRNARSDRYRSRLGVGAKTVASTTMWISGPLVLVFLLVHLWDFRIKKELVDGEVDLAVMVIDRLTSPIGFAIYTVSMAVLGLHLWHAFQSAFQSLGVSHPRYRTLILVTGRALTAVLVAGFAAIPVFLMIKN